MTPALTESRRWWLAAWLAAVVLVNPYVRGDGNGYYAWLVSPVIDGDLDFTNQFRQADPLFQTLIFDEAGAVRDEARTVTGMVGNQWSVGPAVLWLPWFLLAHAGVLVAGAVGAGIAADGYSWPYLWSVSVGTVTYGLLSLWLSACTARRLGLGTGALAVTAVGLASSLPVYQIFLPFHVHALAACAVAAVLAFWAGRPQMPRIMDWVCWGALSGVMVQVYQLNGVLLIAPAWVWLQQLGSRPVVAHLGRGVAFALAGLAVGAPQMMGKAVVYGSPWVSGYQDEFFWSDPRLWDTLWSANHGWWLWTPVAAIGCAGLARLVFRRPDIRPWFLAALAFFGAVASYQNWHGQSSFGNRFFVSLTALVVLGVAAVVGDQPGRRRVWTGAVAALALWNVGFMFQWGTNIIPNRGPVSLGEVAVNQVTVVPSRVTGFLRQYLGDRRGVQETIEREDTIERGGHQVVR